MTSFVRVLQDLGLMVARIATGTILMFHGWARWQAGAPHQAELLKALRVPYPDVFAWGAVIFELLGGMLLVFGLATPVIGLVLLVEQVMIVSYAKWRLGPYQNEGGWELNAALASLGLVFAVFGSGRAGVDSLFRRRDDEGDRRDPDRRRVIDDSDPA